jgi:imidazolonepropionase-like amidohydrolase
MSAPHNPASDGGHPDRRAPSVGRHVGVAKAAGPAVRGLGVLHGLLAVLVVGLGMAHAVMKTLLVNPPSFEKFDGGAMPGMQTVSKIPFRWWGGHSILVLATLLVGLCQASLGQDYDLAAPDSEWREVPISGEATLFQNVRIFDGKTAALSTPSDVLVRGNTIARISASPITVDPETTVIAAGGRVLMPGLIDAHWHALMAAAPKPLFMTADPAYLHLLAARQAEATLMRGFTTVRDLGGPVFGLKRAIDEGVMVGPRIYPSGAFISQTSGHGDFRFAFEVPRMLGGPLSHSEVEGLAAIADSPDEVRLRAREQLRRGASQLKLMAGGGVASPYNPIESTQFTEAEMRAAVEAADNWGTYVTVHAYTPRAIRQAVAAGVKCIEHGQLIDEPTAQLLAEKGIWWSLQPLLDDWCIRGSCPRIWTCNLAKFKEHSPFGRVDNDGAKPVNVP